MFNTIVLGGTFDMLHKGHKKIIESAFMIGKSIVIGLTSDEFANRFRSVRVSPYRVRRKNLESFLKKFRKPYTITKINDSYGIATVDPGLDCIVVSEETLLRAEEINNIRFKKGLDKLNIVVVPLALAEDGKPISSERILSGEIDPDGKTKKQ